MSYKNFSSTNRTLYTANLEYQSTALDKVSAMYEYLFSSNHTLKVKNKNLLLFLQKQISDKRYEVINQFINDLAVSDLHSSLLKSALIMTSSIDGVIINVGKVTHELARRNL